MPSKQLSARPLYLQLRDALAERVASGQWKPGAAIANENDLAREFGVSAGTMRKALDVMEVERLVTRRQGRGTFVNDQTADGLANRFCNIRSTDGRRIAGQFSAGEIVEDDANDAEIERLHLGKHDRVYRMRRIRLDKDRPFMVEDVSVPAALFPRYREIDGGVTHMVALAKQHGLLLGKAEERVSMGVAVPALAVLLGVAVDTPVLVLDRVTHTLDANAAEWRIGYCYLGNEYTYLSEMK
jgi:GntR family transcriptional regulator